MLATPKQRTLRAGGSGGMIESTPAEPATSTVSAECGEVIGFERLVVRSETPSCSVCRRARERR